MFQSGRVVTTLLLAMSILAFGASALSAGPISVPAVEPAGVSVSGRVFHDLNMNGVFDQDPYGNWEPGVDGALVELRAGGALVASQSTTDVGGGAFTFADVAPGNYTVGETDTLNKVSTSDSSVPITVSSADVTVNFGLALKLTVGGRVYVDSGPAGFDTADAILPYATVNIIKDTDGDGVIDAGEPLLGTDDADANGLYAVQNIPPGDCIMAVVPAEIGGNWGAPVPMPLRANTGGEASDIYVPYVPSTPAALSGTVWNDVDGDEMIDEAGEPGLAGATVEVYGAVGGQATGELPAAFAITGADGKYRVDGLFTGWLYEVRPVAATLPTGWLMSADPTQLYKTPPTEVNIGYYNPLATAPLRQSDWKKELKQAGKPRYTLGQVDGFVASAEAASGVFAEVVGIREVLTHSPVHGDLGQALREHAALRLNLASGRLYIQTAVDLPDLTMTNSIGAAVGEIEGILAKDRVPAPTKDDLQRARRLAEALNAGKGLGSGKTGVFGVASATYRGASVVSKLQPAGDLVDLGTDAPAYLLKWSPGTLNTAINVSDAKLRVKVKVFMDGGVLDAVQVRPDGSAELLGTVVPPVWNKDVNATYTFDLRGVSTGVELASTEIRLITRDVSAGGKVARVRVDSAELTFKY